MTAPAWTALAVLLSLPLSVAAAIALGTQRAYRRAPKHPAPRKG